MDEALRGMREDGEESYAAKPDRHGLAVGGDEG